MIRANPKTYLKDRTVEATYESFRASAQTLEDLNKGITASFYKVSEFGQSLLENYSEPEGRVGSICRTLRSMGSGLDAEWERMSDGTINIVIIGESERTIEGYAFGVQDPSTRFTLSLQKRALLKAKNRNSSRLIQRFIHSTIQRHFTQKGFQVVEQSIIDENRDLGQGIVRQLQTQAKSENKPELSNLVDLIALHSSINYSAVLSYGSLHLDLYASTRMVARKSVWDLIVENWQEFEIKSLSRYFSFDGGGTAYLTRILSDLDIDVPLAVHPFYGRTYRDYVRELYPHLTKKLVDKSFLLKAVPRAVKAEWTYATCLMHNTLNYETVANKNPVLYSLVQDIFRQRTFRRLEAIGSFLKDMGTLTLKDGTRISFESQPMTISQQPLQIDFNSESLSTFNPNLPPIFIFSRPELAFRDERGNEIRVGYKKPKDTNKGTLTDLMIDQNLWPYDSPKDVSIVALMPEEFKLEADEFCNNLESGIKGGKYRGFENTFKVKTTITRKIIPGSSVKDFNDFIEKNIPEDTFDTALVFIRTKKAGVEFYAEPKLSLFSKKLPSQMVTVEPRESKTDRSLFYKSTNDEALFNIALQVAAKSGIVSCALPNEFANRLQSSDAILGYDIVEIPVIERLDLEQEWTSTKPSIPQIKLSCPLVVFDPKGANIEHLGVYWVERNNVFDQYGDEIYKKLPAHVKSFTIHKDGSFTAPEIESLENWAKMYGLSGTAVSIIKGDTPRVSRLFAGKPEIPEKGQTIKLSDDFFVMNTTGWPERVGGGWPRPVTIKITSIGGYNSDAMRVLGQVYSFAEIHSGALRGLRTPITIHFPNLIGQVLRKLERPFTSDAFMARTRNGKTPRWFY